MISLLPNNLFENSLVPSYPEEGLHLSLPNPLSGFHPTFFTLGITSKFVLLSLNQNVPSETRGLKRRAVGL